MSASPAIAAPSGRLLSVDALRGFDMFWILGADMVVKAIARLVGWPALADTMEHKVWAGFAYYDLIFPLFLFIAGVSLAFALPRHVAQHGRAGALRRLAWRCVLLFLLGMLYNGGFAEAWPEVRIAGVLQRIAIASFVTGVLLCWCRPAAMCAIGAGLLAGYWALLACVPIRDVTLTKEAMAEHFHAAKPAAADVRKLYESTTATVTGSYDRGRNLANHLDYVWLPGAKYQRYWDPEGLLSTLPAIATCLLGVLAGRRLVCPDRTARQHATWLGAAGIVALAAGWIWHVKFPVVKDLWSSSFVLVAGGWSLLLLAGFHYVIEVLGWRRWCTVFVWIGMNPITLYLASSLVDFTGIATRLSGGSIAVWLDARAAGLGQLAVAGVALGLMIALARFLYRRQIFLRV